MGTPEGRLTATSTATCYGIRRDLRARWVRSAPMSDPASEAIGIVPAISGPVIECVDHNGHIIRMDRASPEG